MHGRGQKCSRLFAYTTLYIFHQMREYTTKQLYIVIYFLKSILPVKIQTKKSFIVRIVVRFQT